MHVFLATLPELNISPKIEFRNSHKLNRIDTIRDKIH